METQIIFFFSNTHLLGSPLNCKVSSFGEWCFHSCTYSSLIKFLSLFVLRSRISIAATLFLFDLTIEILCHFVIGRKLLLCDSVSTAHNVLDVMWTWSFCHSSYFVYSRSTLFRNGKFSIFNSLWISPHVLNRFLISNTLKVLKLVLNWILSSCSEAHFESSIYLISFPEVLFSNILLNPRLLIYVSVIRL